MSSQSAKTEQLCPHTCGCRSVACGLPHAIPGERGSFTRLGLHLSCKTNHPLCDRHCPSFVAAASVAAAAAANADPNWGICEEELEEGEVDDDDDVPAPLPSTKRAREVEKAAAPPLKSSTDSETAEEEQRKKIRASSTPAGDAKAAPSDFFPPVIAECMTPATWTMYFHYATLQMAKDKMKK